MSDNQIWFKRKQYGWGWTPATPEGWIVTIIYMLSVFIYPLSTELLHLEFSMPEFLFVNFVMTAVLIYICIKRGEKPRWSWGDDKKD